MPTDLGTDADRLLDYLAERGGVAEVAPGRALLRQLADDLGWTRAELTAVLGELEAAGAVVREVRDRRTYRLALTADVADDPDKTVILDKFEPAPPPPPAAEVAPAPAPGSTWAPIQQPVPEPSPAKKSRFSRGSRAEKPSKAPKAMSGVVYEIREMNNKSFEGLEGKVISRHKGPKEAFAEVRRLNLQRSGGRFTPRVVVRVDPDGTEDIAIPFDERARPVHFPFTLSGGRI